VALVEGKVKGQTALSAGATAFCSLVLAALIYVVVRRSLRPLPDLSAATARMAAGDFKARISYKGRDELGVLARSFNRMADKLAVSHETLEGQIEERTKELAHKMEELQTARNAALNLMEDSRVQREIAEKAAAGQAEARARFEAVIENTPLVAIQGFDREGKISMWNSASEHIHGYSAPQVLGRRLQDILLAGEVAEEFEHLLKEMWDTGQIAPPREWPVHTGDGEKRLVYASMFPIFERGKVSEIICMNVDITERKRAEEESRQAKEAAEAASGELAVKVKELEEFNRLAVGREMHIIEMKRRINGLHEELGKAPPYDLSFADADGVESDA